MSPGPSLKYLFRNKTSFYSEELLAPRPALKLEDHSFCICPRLLIQYIRSYPLYRRSFLHPQTEDTPCRDDGDALVMDDFCNLIFKTKHDIHSVSASPLSSEKFCVLIQLDNSQILA